MDDPVLRPRKKGRRPTMPLPDDILSDILSRLPVKVVLICRLVCKRWCDLTSTQDFMELHKKKNSTIPMILARQHMKDPTQVTHFLVDASRRRARIHRMLPNSRYWIIFSCDGLLLLERNSFDESQKGFCVLNPMMSPQKEVIINIPLLMLVQVCGIFFHPLVKEYSILWRCFRSDQDGPASFKMLNLGPKPCWRELPTGAAICNDYLAVYPKRLSCAPVVADDILYWLAQHKSRFRAGSDPVAEIIAFDIKRETFSLISHPEPKGNFISHTSYSMNLLKIEDHLSLVESCNFKRSLVINVWILKDYANKIWMKTHTINTQVAYRNRGFRPIAVVNEELILSRPGHSFFACNLQLGTIRKFARNHTRRVYKTWPHVTSLASLMNCQSKIEMQNSDD